LLNKVEDTAMRLPRFRSAARLSLFFLIYVPALPTVAQQDSGHTQNVIRRDGAALRAEAVVRVKPKYPPIARAASEKGTVEVEVTVDESGNVSSARVVSGSPLLREAALTAVRQWKFIPPQINNTRAKLLGRLSFDFDPAGTEVSDVGQSPAKERPPLSLEEQEKYRRASEAADQFIRRWHETLDLNVLFDEMYVSDPGQRRKNAELFYGVYIFLTGTGGDPAIEEGIDEQVMREGFFAFWNAAYLGQEYGLVCSRPEDNDSALNDKLEKAREKLRKGGRRELDETKMRLKPVRNYIARVNVISSLLRKRLPVEVFSSACYEENSRRQQSWWGGAAPSFRIIRGMEDFGVPPDVEVYWIERGIFEFYFVEEGGVLKVLTLGFEL
jgi:TonB family protein